MGYHNNPTELKLKLPSLSCDAHFHILGLKARFPFDAKFAVHALWMRRRTC